MYQQKKFTATAGHHFKEAEKESRIATIKLVANYPTQNNFSRRG